MTDPCKHEKTVGSMLSDIDFLKQQQMAQGLVVKEIFQEIRCINKMLNNRPSWAVAAYITIVTTLLAASAVYIITG